jgi:trans-aconitate 2-methyltransferase
MTDWSAKQYLKFEDERTRPARELLAQVPLTDPKRIVDLGCGPGNSTELLVARFPGAEVIGLDSSPEMLEAARKRLPQCRFIEADLATWMPEAECDLLYSNAVFHWVPDHLAVLKRLCGKLSPGGVLAVQMPDNLAEPMHVLAAETAKDGSWAARLAQAAEVREAIPKPERYYDGLKPEMSRVDIWHTIYNHPLDGAEGIVAWHRSTGLRPYLNPLGEDDQVAFLARYTQRVAEAYPLRADGKALLHFPRIFIVAVK